MMPLPHKAGSQNNGVSSHRLLVLSAQHQYADDEDVDREVVDDDNTDEEQEDEYKENDPLGGEEEVNHAHDISIDDGHDTSTDAIVDVGPDASIDTSNEGSRGHANKQQQTHTHAPHVALPPLPSIHPLPSAFSLTSTQHSSPSSTCAGLSSVFSLSNLHRSFQSIGVIYGDIGTSPLYTVTAIFSSSSDDPSLTLDPTVEADVLGAMSLIFWSLTMVVTIKYVMIVMLADDHGEGGSFALLGLLRRHKQAEQQHTTTTTTVTKQTVSPSSPQKKQTSLTEDGTERQQTEEEEESQEEQQQEKEERKEAAELMQDESSAVADLKVSLSRSASPPPSSPHLWLLHDPLRLLTLMSFFGAALLIGDGIITPAISVLSAVEGIAVINSSLSGLVLPLSLLILFLLFMWQRFGTAKVAGLFSPIMVVWFVTLFTLGVYNLSTAPAQYTLSICSSVSPYYALSFIARHGWTSLNHMAAIVLCVTGVEAMFADMGHFDRTSIRTSWLVLVYPSLVLQYLGQGVCLLQDASINGNVFYGAVPYSYTVYWYMVILSTCATIIASQALISGGFSLTRAAIRLRFAPNLTVYSTSLTSSGHIYIPSVNYLLMICTCLCVLAFKTSTNLANAYGVAVCCDMLLTSTFLCCIMRFVWHKPRWTILGYICIFMTIDASFLIGNLAKIVAGGWLPITFALVLSSLLYVWEWGQRKLMKIQKNPLWEDNDQWNAVRLALLATSDIKHKQHAETVETVDGIITPLAAHHKVIQIGEDQCWSVFFYQPSECDDHLASSTTHSTTGDTSASSTTTTTDLSVVVPLSARKFFSHMKAFPARCLFVAITVKPHAPYVQEEQRISFGRREKWTVPVTASTNRTETVIEQQQDQYVWIQELTLYYGYMEDPAVRIARDILQAIENITQDSNSPFASTTATTAAEEWEDNNSSHHGSARYFLSGEEMLLGSGPTVPPSASSLSSYIPAHGPTLWQNVQSRAKSFYAWLRFLPDYWLVTLFNFMSRGTCHGDDYELPTQHILKLVSKTDLRQMEQIE